MKDPKKWENYIEFVHAQVEELMSLYGKIDILWYDGAWPSHSIPGWDYEPTEKEIAEAWRSRELNNMVRSLQPDILINDRSYLPEDFGTPEKKITPEHRPWELCDTIGDLWGAASQDLNWKTPREILTRLITCVSLSGNMLLNIGPNADGSIQELQANVMARIGDWMRIHGEAIYGCVGEWKSPFNNGLAPWRTTRNGDLLYLHLLRYPGPKFSIANIHDYWLKSAELIDTGEKLKITHERTRDVIEGIPPFSPDEIAPVVKIVTRPINNGEQKTRETIGMDKPDSVL